MGRPKKLIEYKNVSENELMFLEVFGEEETKHKVEIRAGQSIFLTERDLRNHSNDTRFLEGRIVPIGSEAEIASTKEASDIMTDKQITYFIKNNNDPEEIKKKLEFVKSIQTMSRILKEAKLPEQSKTYIFVTTIEEVLKNLIKEKE